MSNRFRPRLWLVGIVLISMAAIATGCKSEPAAEGDVNMAIQVTSSAFKEGESIPKKHTCDGENRSPALSWSGIPLGTASLALIADDPDAPAGTWVHWVLADLPADRIGLAEGETGLGVEGVNGFRKAGYGGPCPPRGSTHRYFFKIYALDKKLGLKAGMTKSEVEKAMQGHILAQGQLMGRYSR